MAKAPIAKPAPTESLNPVKLGNAVFIRTVTMYYTGRIVEILDKVLILTDAAWIADTGRFSQALEKGVLGEVEPYPNPVAINRDHILDVTMWNHTLPRETK